MEKHTVTARYPWTGDVYTAESACRVRVEHADQWGYFDDRGNWLEGPLRHADPCFCLYISTQWQVEQDPARWLRVAHWPKESS
jgi:hypothetical protein